MNNTIFAAMTETLSQSVPSPPGDQYIGDDGLLHCSKCHKATQFRCEVKALGISRIVKCACQCVVDAEKAADWDMKRHERESMRRTCFGRGQEEMANWTFENDDRRNAKLSDAMQRYAENFADFRRKNKGLLLYGDVGRGKTYFAACIANRLMDKGVPCMMTNFARIRNQIQGTFNGKQDIIDDLNRYSLLVIDDLGIESQSDYVQEIVFDVIDARYRMGAPLIITTNLTADELKKPQDVKRQRIYERALERSFPIEVTGENRRREKFKATYDETREMLGL